MAAEINDNKTATLKEALHRFVEVYLQGQQPNIDEFVQQYPQHEAQLRKRIQDLREIDTLFDSIFLADGSEFEVAEHNLVGRKIGSFEVEKLIGRGGMGIVYLARDTKLKRSVAVKSLPFKIAGDSDSLTRFRREAEILASLNHPNIAVIHEIIEQDKDGSYLVLEYVPGETLTERIAREPLKLEEAISISQQVAEAISAAHKKGIAHRDLKPGNIMITPEDRVKVLDFGLATSSPNEDVENDISITESGHVMGTPAYMSPEQANGKDADYRIDIWSFGCILFQMLTGRLPFEGQTATDTLACIIEREPDWDLLPKETPANVRTLLRGCLEKDPDRRVGDIKDASIEITKTLSTPSLTMPVRLRRTAITIGMITIVVLSSVVTWFALTKKAQPIRLLVLPFENLTSDEKEYFSTGLMNEIGTRLKGIHGLRVYKSKEKGAKQVAKEIGVDYILEGMVQRERSSDPNSQVTIRPQLIRVTDDVQVWADIYENNISGVFRLLSDVADQVTQALDMTLTESQRQGLASKVTKNPQAYHYYVRGNEYSSRPYQNKEDLMIAIQMYEMAIALDNKFALAHARLSHAYSGMYQFSHDRSEERLAMAWEESKRALELDPELPEAHWARSVYYYWGHRDYDLALKELDIALKGQPDNSRFIATIGHIQRRQGKFEEALASYRKAFDIDPLSYTAAGSLARTFRQLQRYREAEYYYEWNISLAPDEPYQYFEKASLYLLWRGNTVEARKILNRASKYIDLKSEYRMVRLQFRLDLFDGKYNEALARLPLDSPTTDDLSFPDALRYAEIYGYLKDKKSAVKYYEQAMQVLKSKLWEDPNNAWYHNALGVAYAGLGRKNDAIQEAECAVKLMPYAEDRLEGFNAAKDLAYIYTMVGKYDAAIEKIEFLLSVPGELSIPLLKLDPAWKPLHNHPNFKELIEYGK